MKKFICIVAGLLMSASPGLAATKTLKRTVDETQLQGYVATPPAGWAQSKFTYGAATPIGSAAPVAYALSNQVMLWDSDGSAPLPTVPPPPVGLTLISLSRFALTKEKLPDTVQITANDCIVPNFSNPTQNVCPFLWTIVRPSAAVPGGLLFLMMKLVHYRSSTVGKYFEYIFDPSAVGAERWMLVQSGIVDFVSDFFQRFDEEHAYNLSTDVGKFGDVNLLGQTFRVADPNWYIFKRASPTIMQIYQIAPK